MADPAQSRPYDSSAPPGSRLTGPPTAVEGTPAFGPPLSPDELGTLGPYRLVKELGHGGMGAVYLAFDQRLKRKVALKVMLPQYAVIASAKERFLREARAAATLSHDHIVTIYEAYATNGVPFIAMQFLQGTPLDAYLKAKGPPPWQQAVRIGRETALGLAEAHKHGIVHRDIKPANLWLEAPKGRVKILDFGLATPAESDVSGNLTATGAIMGTPAYLSPEQARGEKVDHRADLFSLGVVLYQLCTGKQPFTGTNILAILTSLAIDEPRSVRELNPAVPDALADLIQQLMSKNADGRPASALAVADLLQKIKDGNVGSVSMPVISVGSLPVMDDFSQLSAPIDATEPVAVPPPRARRPAVVYGGIAAVVLAIAVVTAVLSRPKDSPSVPQAVKPPEKSAPLPPIPTGPDARGRMPVPPREKIDAQRAVLHDPKAQKDWASVKPATKRDAARQLLQRGPATTNDAKAYAELELAAEFARETGDVATGLAVCDAQVKRFQVGDLLTLKVDSLEKLAEAVKKMDGAKPVVGWDEWNQYRNDLFQLGLAAAVGDDYALADRVLAAAKKFTSTDVSDWYANQLGQFEDRVKELRIGKDWVRPFEEALQQDANNSDAQARVGEYAALVRHEWAKGAALVHESKTERPSRLAFEKEKAARAKPSSVAYADAADAWWVAAEVADPPMQVPTRRRARYWYLAAILQVPDTGMWGAFSTVKPPTPERLALVRRAQPRIDSVPTKPVSLNLTIADTVRAYHLTFAGHGYTTSHQTGDRREVRLNHRRWPGHIPHTLNEGLDWLYPYDVDFSTARQTRGSQVHSGLIFCAPGTNGLDLHTYREPTGRATYDFRLTFQADGFLDPNRFLQTPWDITYYPLPPQKGNMSTDDAWDRLLATAPGFKAKSPSLEVSSIDYAYTNLVQFFPIPGGVQWKDFGLVATTERTMPAGDYELREFHDDAIRFFVDDYLIVRSGTWEDTATKFSLKADGKHRLRVEFIQNAGPFTLTHWLRRLGP